MISFAIQSNVNFYIFSREIINIITVIALWLVVANDELRIEIKPHEYYLLVALYSLKLLAYYAFLHGKISLTKQPWQEGLSFSYNDFSLMLLLIINLLSLKQNMIIVRNLLIAPLVFVGGSSTLILIYFASFLYLISTRNSKSLYFCVGTITVLLSFTIFKNEFLNFMIYYGSRNYPLVEYWNSSTFRDIIVGTGLGVGIEIPWFIVEDDKIGNRSIFYDNMYGTILIKFGVLGFLGLLYAVRKLFQKNEFLGVVIILSGLTSSVVYQTSFLLFIYFMLLLNFPDKKLKIRF